MKASQAQLRANKRWYRKNRKHVQAYHHKYNLEMKKARAYYRKHVLHE